MASIDNSRVALGTGIFAGLGALVSRFTGSVTAWNDARVTRNALSKLSDRELNDIGLCRGDIGSVTHR